jgi:DNA-directed RNA polymerase specialized sigma24 family protein
VKILRSEIALVDFDVDMDDIRRVKAGDNRRFNKILDKYSILIDSVKRKYDADGYDEDDLAQIVRISIWKAVIAFDEGKLEDHSKVPNQLTKLVKKIVYHDIGSVFERQGEPMRDGVEVEFDEQKFPVEIDDDNRLFLKEISHMFGGIKAKIINFIILGYTQKEIAVKLGYSRTTVHEHLSAIKKFAIC